MQQKKKRFKYQVGQSVQFNYFDGTSYKGIIVKRGYRNEDVSYLPTEYNQPNYTMHCVDRSGNYSRGYMSYPSIPSSFIKSVLPYTINIMPLKDYPTSTTVRQPMNVIMANSPTISVPASEPTLDQAIDKQREFLKR